MSVVPPQYVPAPPLGRPLRARPLGLRAALGMGCTASVILLGTLIFGGARHPDDHQTVASAASPVGAETVKPTIPKIAAKADTPDADTALPSVTQAKLPFSAFDLKAPEFEQEKKSISFRDGDDGAGRVDSVALGQFAAGAQFLRVDMHQGVTEKETDADFFLDMRRHASQAGLDTVKVSPPTDLQTRFGALETAEIRLAQPASDGVAASERGCLAGRLIAEESGLIITGVACGAGDKPLDRVAFGCLIDRLDYSANGDEKVAAFFGKAGASKNCNVSRDDLTATVPKKETKQRRRRR